EVEQRVVRRRTLFELDLGLASLAPHSQSRESDAAPSDIPAETKYVAVLLSQKGRLHDYAMITDGQGNAVSALSYPEFRILAGLTLRRLLLAAFGDAPVPAPFLELERRYFELFLQFGVVTKDDDEINTERRRDRILAELDA